MPDKEIIKTMNTMALPVLASSFGQMIFSVADQAIIGRLSVEGFAAVGVVANLIYLLTGTLGALSVAFVIIFGKAIGSADNIKQSKIFSTAFSLALIIGVGFGIISIVFGGWFLREFYGLKGQVHEYAYDYLAIAGWGLGLNTLIFLFTSYFKNLKKTNISLIANLISLTVNFIIDYTLVFGKFGMPRLGVKGAAIGTVVGLALNVLIFIFFFKRHKTVNFRFMIKLNEIKEIMKLYFPIMGQDFVESTLFVMLITAIVTRLDTYSIAVYNLLEVVASVIILPAYSYGGVAMALVSQNFNNQSNTELNRYPKTAVICSLFFISTLTGIIFIFPDILGIITDDSKLLTEAYGICIFALLIQLINAVSQVYKYTLQSIGYETWILKYSTIISLLSCIVIYFAISVFELGLVGLYIGMGLMYFMLATGYTGKTIMG